MTPLAGSSKLLRAMNSSASLALLLERGPLTRSDLRELTGLSMPTASEMLRRLTDAGLAVVAGHTSGSRGPHAALYAANPGAGHAAAVSIRETARTHLPSLAVAVCDLEGTVLARTDTSADLRQADPLDTISEVVTGVCRQAELGADQVRHLQIGVPGSYDQGSDTIRHIDVPGFDRPGLVGALAERLGVTVAVENDVNLAAIAERSRGAGSGVDSFALLWFGEGLGLAIDLGGVLLRGARGGAGEIGYLPLGLGRGPGVPDLQDLVGGPAVLALGASHHLPGATPAEVVAAAAADPGAGAGFIESLAARMAVGLAAVAVVLDPPLVVLAGDVARAGGEVLGNAVAEALHATTPLVTPVAVSTVGDDAVLLGGLDSGVRAVRQTLIDSLRDTVGPTARS